MATGPLNGVRILEFTQIIAGPFGCMMLADQGAEVIKIEPPAGESWRHNSPFLPGESKGYQSLNRGKESLALALADPRAMEVIHRLMPTIDVVVINYRPDVAARLKIDYESLAKLKPDLIYVDITAFGRKGPNAQRPGYDIIVQGVSGMMAQDAKLSHDGTRPEAVTATAVADFSTGLTVAWAVTSALFHRERTGEGQLVEATLLATALAVMGSSVMELPAADAARNTMRDRRRALQREHAPYAELLEVSRATRGVPNIYYRTYRTKDGAVVIGALSPALWTKVRAALETEFMGSADPNFDPLNPEYVAWAEEQVAAVEEHVAQKTTDEWIAILEAAGVPVGPVKFVDEMSEDPQVIANEMMVELQHEISGPQTMVGPILKFAKSPMAAQGASPVLGAHTQKWLAQLGYNEGEIGELYAEGVVA